MVIDGTARQVTSCGTFRVGDLVVGPNGETGRVDYLGSDADGGMEVEFSTGVTVGVGSDSFGQWTQVTKDGEPIRAVRVRAGRKLIDAVEAYLASGTLSEAAELRKATEEACREYFRALGDKTPPQATVYSAMIYAREAAERYPELSRGGIR